MKILEICPSHLSDVATFFTLGNPKKSFFNIIIHIQKNKRGPFFGHNVHVRSSPIFVHVSMAVARSSSSGVAIRYVHPVV